MNGIYYTRKESSGKDEAIFFMSRDKVRASFKQTQQDVY